MKPRENIQDIEKQFIHIVNHLRTLGKTFLVEYLINKILRCISRSWKPKVTMICEFEDFYYMDLATLFGNLQEHEIYVKRLVENEEGNNKKKSLALKVEEAKNSETYKDMNLLV